MPPYRTCHSERSEESKGLVWNHYGLVKATYADEKSAAVPGQRPEAGFKPASTKQRCDGAHFHGNDRRWGSVSRRGGSRTAPGLRPDSHPLPRLPAYRTVVLRTDATSGTGRCEPYDESPSSTLEEAGPAAIPVYPALRAGWYPPRGQPCRRYLHGHRPPVVAHRPLLSGAIGRCLGVVPGRAAGAPPRRRRCAGHGPSLRALCRIVLPEKYGPLPRARASILDMALRALVTDRVRPARRPPIGGHHRPPRPPAVTLRDARPMR